MSDSLKKILVIGNSITKHERCSYWWHNGGMGASRIEKDFGHIIMKNLPINYEVEILNFYVWEMFAHDRAESLEYLDKYLGEKIKIIIVQLGDNVLYNDSLYLDFMDLIVFLRNRVPIGKIMMVGNWFLLDEKVEEIKRRISKENDIIYISLEDICNKDEYFVGLGTKIYDDTGKEHVVNHDGVAIHPNDKAMQYIADKILHRINLLKL